LGLRGGDLRHPRNWVNRRPDILVRQVTIADKNVCATGQWCMADLLVCLNGSADEDIYAIYKNG